MRHARSSRVPCTRSKSARRVGTFASAKAMRTGMVHIGTLELLPKKWQTNWKNRCCFTTSSDTTQPRHESPVQLGGKKRGRAATLLLDAARQTNVEVSALFLFLSGDLNEKTTC
jgi:hypothetical protein